MGDRIRAIIEYIWILNYWYSLESKRLSTLGIHGLANGKERMLVGLAVTGCCWPFVSSFTRSVT